MIYLYIVIGGLFLYIVIGGLFLYQAMSQIYYEIGKYIDNKDKSDYQKTIERIREAIEIWQEVNPEDDEEVDD